MFNVYHEGLFVGYFLDEFIFHIKDYSFQSVEKGEEEDETKLCDERDAIYVEDERVIIHCSYLMNIFTIFSKLII